MNLVSSVAREIQQRTEHVEEPGGGLLLLQEGRSFREHAAHWSTCEYLSTRSSSLCY